MEYVVEPTREESIAMLKAGLDKVLMNVAASYVIPIFWLIAKDGMKRPRS